MPRTGLEPARLSTLAPETSASTIPPPGLAGAKLGDFFGLCKFLRGFFVSGAFFSRFFGRADYLYYFCE